LGLDHFFPEYGRYLKDIESLVRGHSDHLTAGMERRFAKHTARYGLDGKRVEDVLLPLVQAADTVDLSHTLDERRHKERFLGKLNTASAVQYVFVSHRLDEQRGILTNVLHNAIVAELREGLGLVPLLFYPEGVAYLAPRGKPLALDDVLLQGMGRRAAQTVAQMVGSNFRDFISRRPAGMKVDPKCLELGIPFAGEDGIWRQIYSLLQRATFDVEAVAQAVADRTRADWQRRAATAPAVAAEVEALLEAPRKLVPESGQRLRLGELIRSYYLFLKDQFGDQLPDPWPHLYRLLELPPQRDAFYAFFGDRYDRAYVITRDLALSEEQVYRRLEADGEELLAGRMQDDPNASLLTEYLHRYAIFSFAPPDASALAGSLDHYVANQHRQCVNCAAPFPTNDWMAADVRSDVTVQAFSNRLRGGPGEPKKQVCAICHLQFLLEKLNYPTVRDEQPHYLHLFPYSFVTEAFLQGIRGTIRRVLAVEPDARALHVNADVAGLRRLGSGQPVRLDFSTRTSQEKLHPYGLYLPRFSQSVGNLLTFPVNPGGVNDSARFLFALWYALLLQRHFGMKVLLTATPVAPLRKEDFGDLYVDAIPLSVRGLLRQNDFARYDGESQRDGSRWELWRTVER
ncbi:MAG TPA: type I-D CRISPR-associated protein Cas10d/Csc3, partial [Ardenticatenaceae bacterium]|nr:type I-D CRISPR-associated protein Cas10d/Csc3 [Ardenticatenaceae bacterium]